MDTVSWGGIICLALLNAIAIWGLARLFLSICAEEERRHRQSELAWRREGK